MCSGTGLGQNEHVSCWKCRGTGELPMTDKDLKQSRDALGDAIDAVDWAAKMLDETDTLGECEADIAECIRLLKKVSPLLAKTLAGVCEQIERQENLP